MSAIAGYLTPDEAAAVIGVSHSQVTRYIKDERLPSMRVGWQILIPTKAVESFRRPPRGNPNFRESAK